MKPDPRIPEAVRVSLTADPISNLRLVSAEDVAHLGDLDRLAIELQSRPRTPPEPTFRWWGGA